MKRRALLASVSGLALSSLAGCIGGVLYDEPIPDIDLTNETGSRRQFALTITRDADGIVVFDETLTLEAGAWQRYDDPMTESGPHTVRLVTDGLEESYEYQSCGQRDICGLAIIVHQDRIEWYHTEA